MRRARRFLPTSVFLSRGVDKWRRRGKLSDGKSLRNTRFVLTTAACAAEDPAAICGISDYVVCVSESWQLREKSQVSGKQAGKEVSLL